MDGLNVREVRSGSASAIVAESLAMPPRIRSKVLEVRSVYVPENNRKAGLATAKLASEMRCCASCALMLTSQEMRCS